MGGKDSTATLIKAINNCDKEIYPVFNDTGWEHPITYDYLEYLEKITGLKIYRTTGHKKAGDLMTLIRQRGEWPTGLKRFCTMYLKQYALKDWYKENLLGTEKFYFLFGLRQQESNQRMRKYGDIKNDETHDPEEIFPARYTKQMREEIKIILPIVEWSTDEVFKYLADNGVKYNPLYDEGTNNRVGCYPCLLSGKKVQNLMFQTEEGKKRLEIIKQVEKEINKKYEPHDTGFACSICQM